MLSPGQGEPLQAPALPQNKFNLLLPQEVAERLRCHVSTVYVLYHEGRLKGFSLTGNCDPSKRGKKGLRFLESSVDDFIQSGLQQVPAPPRHEPLPPALSLPEVTPARRGGSRVVLPPP